MAFEIHVFFSISYQEINLLTSLNTDQSCFRLSVWCQNKLFWTDYFFHTCIKTVCCTSENKKKSIRYFLRLIIWSFPVPLLLRLRRAKAANRVCRPQAAWLTMEAIHLPLCYNEKATDPGPVASHEGWAYLLLPSLPEWTLIRGAHWWVAASLLNAHSAGVTSFEGAMNPPAANPLRGRCDLDCGILLEIRSSNLTRSFSELLFEDSWFFKLHWTWLFHLTTYVRGGVSFCLYLRIKSHIFLIKEENGNFLKSPNAFQDLL